MQARKSRPHEIASLRRGPNDDFMRSQRCDGAGRVFFNPAFGKNPENKYLRHRFEKM
jgi:hypothetical protein